MTAREVRRPRTRQTTARVPKRTFPEVDYMLHVIV